MKDIVNDSNKILRQKSKEVPLPLQKEDQELLQSMYEYLKNSQNDDFARENDLRPAVGIAAVQLGKLKRMCAILIQDYDDDGNVISEKGYALVNPKIISHTTKKAYLKSGEGCLSVDKTIEGYVPRYAKVTVEAYDLLKNQNVTIIARGYEAIVFQHELDHFDGIMFYDHINQQDPFTPYPNAMIIE